MIYIIAFITSGLFAVLSALSGIFSGAAIANKNAQDRRETLAAWLMGGGLGVAVLIAILYIAGAIMRYKLFAPAWLANALMFSGVPLGLVFIAIVFSNLPK